MKPSNRLLLTVVVISFLVALTVAGTAIGVNWVQSLSREDRSLKGQLQHASAAIDFFSLTQSQTQTQQELAKAASMVAQYVSTVGYQFTTDTILETQMKTVQIIGAIIDAYFMKTYQRFFANTAMVLATLLDLMCQEGYVNQAIALVNHLNANVLIEGWEVVLANYSAPNTTTPNFLAKQRYSQFCPNGTCPVTSNSSAGIRRALRGLNGSVVGFDYTMRMNMQGYAYIPSVKFGLAFKCTVMELQVEFQQMIGRAIDAANMVFTDTTELMLLKLDSDGTTVRNLSHLRFESGCQGGCNLAGFRPAVNGTNASGQFVGLGYRGSPNLMSYLVLANINASLLMKVRTSDITSPVLDSLGTSLWATSKALPGTEEVFLVHKTVSANGTVGVEMLSQRKFESQCPEGQCESAYASHAAAVLCLNGAAQTTVSPSTLHVLLADLVRGFLISPGLSRA